MKKIDGIIHIASNNGDDFHDKLVKNIYSLQKDGQEVEVQYGSNTSGTIKGIALFSALIIGRK